MADIDLTQEEADALIAMEKHAVDLSVNWEYPDTGGSISIPLQSSDKRERFLLDISRGRIDLQKGKYQNRARQVIVLARLDYGGSPHRNPDGIEVACPHLHIFREGFGDKWAAPLPPDFVDDPDDRLKLMDAFLKYCNVTIRPNISFGLFI